MEPYLTARNLGILCTVWKHHGYISATKAIGTGHHGASASDVRFLSDEGFLSRSPNGQYTSNRRTEKALFDHGFDLDEIQRVERPPEDAKPVPEEVQPETTENFDIDVAQLDRKKMQDVLYIRAITEALAGDPWKLVALQWPELVIHDELDKQYFKKYCDRDYALNLRLDDVQCEFLIHGFDPTVREIFIKGSTSPGKGFITALFIDLWYFLFPDDRIITTSQSSAHAKDVMLAEVITWRKKMDRPGPGEALTRELKDDENPRHVLIIANPDTGEGVSGRHGANTLGIIDEGSSVAPFMLKNLRKQCRKIICISNPLCSLRLVL